MSVVSARFLSELLRLLFDCGWFRTERYVPGNLHALKVPALPRASPPSRAAVACCLARPAVALAVQ